MSQLDYKNKVELLGYYGGDITHATKVCSQCHTLKDITEFYRDNNKKSGYRYNCKKCQDASSKRWYDRVGGATRPTVKEYRSRPEVMKRRAIMAVEWRESHLASVLVTKARARAREYGVPCTIVKEDIVIPAVCPALGIPLVISKGVMGDSSPTIDRIVPSKGYVKGNIQVISLKANRMKSNGTADELMAVATWLRSLNGR